MKRKDFLKAVGIASAVPLMPVGKWLAGETKAEAEKTASCVLIPSETAGPFPLDLTTNTFYFRQDLRESKAGVQLNVRLKILGLDNCEPMANVRVNIWHCDKDGSYSGYSVSNGNTTNTVGETWLRGYQITDANGEVEFITIFPGWYSGRICHIHFQVYVSTSYAAISQLSFDINAKNALYAANSSLYTKGADPMTFSSDNIFSDGYAYQLATLTPNSTTGGYDTYLEVTVQGAGTTGIGHQEKEVARQFELGQNFPNPFTQTTQIPIVLKIPAQVTLQIWDLEGRMVAQSDMGNLNAGEHWAQVDLKEWGLSQGSYVYQVEVVNANGTYRQYKLMTGMK